MQNVTSTSLSLEARKTLLLFPRHSAAIRALFNTDLTETFIKKEGEMEQDSDMRALMSLHQFLLLRESSPDDSLLGTLISSGTDSVINARVPFPSIQKVLKEKIKKDELWITYSAVIYAIHSLFAAKFSEFWKERVQKTMFWDGSPFKERDFKLILGSILTYLKSNGLPIRENLISSLSDPKVTDWSQIPYEDFGLMGQMMVDFMNSITYSSYTMMAVRYRLAMVILFTISLIDVSPQFSSDSPVWEYVYKKPSIISKRNQKTILLLGVKDCDLINDMYKSFFSHGSKETRFGRAGINDLMIGMLEHNLGIAKKITEDNHEEKSPHYKVNTYIALWMYTCTEEYIKKCKEEKSRSDDADLLVLLKEYEARFNRERKTECIAPISRMKTDGQYSALDSAQKVARVSKDLMMEAMQLFSEKSPDDSRTLKFSQNVALSSVKNDRNIKVDKNYLPDSFPQNISFIKPKMEALFTNRVAKVHFSYVNFSELDSLAKDLETVNGYDLYVIFVSSPGTISYEFTAVTIRPPSGSTKTSINMLDISNSILGTNLSTIRNKVSSMKPEWGNSTVISMDYGNFLSGEGLDPKYGSNYLIYGIWMVDCAIQGLDLDEMKWLLMMIDHPQTFLFNDYLSVLNTLK